MEQNSQNLAQLFPSVLTLLMTSTTMQQPSPLQPHPAITLPLTSLNNSPQCKPVNLAAINQQIEENI